jgi:opacity protein-like surface antigen
MQDAFKLRASEGAAMRRRLLSGFLLATIAIAATPRAARADGFITPFLGINFANDSGKNHSNLGVSFGWMGAGIAGVEGDVGFAPNFFGDAGDFGDNSVLTGMLNLIVGVPGGSKHGPGIRPYGTVGVGFIRTKVTGAPPLVPHIDDNNAGVSGGFGVISFLSEHVGLRADVRYFRNFRDTPINEVQFGSFHFWRADIGIVIRP